MRAGARYVFSWNVTNSADERTSPEISVSASGTATFRKAPVSKPHTLRYVSSAHLVSQMY